MSEARKDGPAFGVAEKPLQWSRDWEVGVQVQIERRGRSVVDETLADLLNAIRQTSSISAAARLLRISYRHAWKLVQAGNEAAGEPLVTAAVGGVKGGGAQLTLRGEAALVRFEAIRDQVRDSAAHLLQRSIQRNSDDKATVHVSAAISLQEVFGQILAEYTLKKPHIRVRSVYGSSNELAEHVLSGAPCDLFLSADATHLDRLAAEQRLKTNSLTPIAINGLIAVGGESAPKIESAEDLARSKPLVLADPASPLGKCSRAYLERGGLWEQARKNAMFVDNSGAVFSAIRAGRACAGLAFASDVGKAVGCQVLFAAHSVKEATVAYSAAVLKGSRESDSQALLEFLDSTVARRCFRRCGFELPRRAKTPSAAVGRSSQRKRFAVEDVGHPPLAGQRRRRCRCRRRWPPSSRSGRRTR